MDFSLILMVQLSWSSWTAIWLSGYCLMALRLLTSWFFGYHTQLLDFCYGVHCLVKVGNHAMGSREPHQSWPTWIKYNRQITYHIGISKIHLRNSMKHPVSPLRAKV